MVIFTKSGVLLGTSGIKTIFHGFGTGSAIFFYKYRSFGYTLLGLKSERSNNLYLMFGFQALGGRYIRTMLGFLKKDLSPFYTKGPKNTKKMAEKC